MQNGAATGMALPIRARLRDGRQVTLRQVEAHDKPRMLAAFHRLSADSRYTRFMMAMRDVSDAMLEAATHPAPDRDFALVAVSGEGGADTIVGGARYAGDPGSGTCEFAVTVADDWHGLGLATRLMGSLIETARARGWRCMQGYVLTVNTPMRHLAKRLGFIDLPSEGDATLREVRMSLVEDGCGDPAARPA